MRRFIYGFIGALVLFVAPEVFSQNEQVYARVTADGLRVRSDWNLDATVLWGLKSNEIVSILAQSPSTQTIGEMEDYWYEIMTSDGQTGWAYGYFLHLFTRYEFPEFTVSVDSKLAGSVSVKERDAFTDGRSGNAWPRHRSLVLEDYALSGVSEINRQLYIFSTDSGTSPRTIVTGAPEQLRGALAGPLDSGGRLQANLHDAVPVIPEPAGAHQAFVTAAEPIPFTDGEGVRFITQYVQDLVWPPSRTIHYVYQGYATDESAYIAAWFQIRRPDTASDEKPRPSDEEIWEAYAAYGRELEELPAEAFSPDLSLLDAFIRSVSVTW